jgi:hypothetical protein
MCVSLALALRFLTAETQRVAKGSVFGGAFRFEKIISPCLWNNGAFTQSLELGIDSLFHSVTFVEQIRFKRRIILRINRETNTNCTIQKDKTLNIMTLKHTLFLIAAFISVNTFAQRFNWSASSGYPEIVNSYRGAVDLTTDAQGNVYTFDYANLDQVCQGDTIERVSNGSNLFVYKFNPNGELIWAKAFGSGEAGAAVVPLNLEMGPDNNLYALVHINGNDIVSEDGTFQVISPTNVILCIDENGMLNWVESAEFNCTACFLLEIANEQIYYQAGATLIKSMAFDQSPVTNYSFYFDPATAILTLPIQGSAHFNNGDILLAGLQRGNASFISGDTLSLIGNPGLYSNISYVRLTPDLQPVWANSFGSLHDPEQHFIPVAIDSTDQIYTAWELLDTVTIAGTTVEGGFNNWAGTILSMDGNGNSLWFRELASDASMQLNDLLADITSNKIWVTGISNPPTTVGDSVLTPHVNGSPILASVNSDGVFANQITLNELPGTSQGLSLAKGLTNQLYLGGRLNGGSDYTINCLDYDGNYGLFVASFFDIPQNPPMPSITADGLLLTASPEFDGSIQWLFNGVELAGATSQSIEATAEGDYSVVYSYDFGCEGEATSSIVFVSNSVSKLNEESVMVIPNPADAVISIRIPGGERASVHIYSADGKLVRDGLTNATAIDISDLNPGLYLIRVLVNNEQYQTTLLKK